MTNRISYGPLLKGPFPKSPKIIEFWVSEYGIGALVEGNRDYAAPHEHEVSDEDYNKWWRWIDARAKEIKS